MSDTQSSEELQIRVEQKMEAKLRDLLDKAKNITPFYDDETLLLIYKDCFHTDHVFLNKLEIIAKNHKNAQQEEDRDWIQFKQQQKAAVKVANNETHTQEREKFNFLEDKELLQRAKYFDPERQRAQWQRRKEDMRQRQQNKYKSNNQNNTKFKEKLQNQEVVQPQKKMKFKEKVEEPNTSEIKYQPAQQTSSKPATKYVEKKQKYVEKKTDKPDQTVVESNKKPENPSNNEHSGAKKEVKQHQKPKYQEKVSKPQTIAESQQPKIQSKQQKSQNSHVKQQPKTVVNQATSQKVIQSLTNKITSQKEIDPDVKREFDQSCRLNSFILKFIPPTSKLQKISYIRDSNGTYREVKTRQTLAK